MGSVIEWGVDTRCRGCKGTGERGGKKGGSRCGMCKGVGYIHREICMCICGCTSEVDKYLVFVCMSCYNEVNHYSPSCFSD